MYCLNYKKRQSLKITGIVLIAGWLGCRSPAPQDHIYPLLDRWQGTFDLVLTRSEGQQSTPAALPEVAALLQMEPLRVLGAQEGQPPTYFLGGVAYATFDPAGRLVIVDEENYAVLFFDRTGNFLFKLGRQGEGPGAFQTAPVYAAFDRQGRLYVMERGSGRIHRFIEEEDIFTWERTYALSSELGGAALGWCLLQDTLYVYANPLNWWERPLLHVLTLEGKHIRAFGMLDFYPKEGLPEGTPPLMLEARLFCDPYHAGLILAYRYLPVVEYYTTEGKRRWRLRLEEVPLLAYRVDGALIEPVLRKQGTLLRNVVVFPSGAVLLHIAEQVMRDDQPTVVEREATYAFWIAPGLKTWGWFTVSFPFRQLYDRAGPLWLGTGTESALPHVVVFQVPENIRAAVAKLP